jgi:hypothetical protein
MVTFRLDQATWDFMRQLVPYTRYGNTSSFIREGIELLLKQEEEQRSGWSVGPAAKEVTDPVPGLAVMDVPGKPRRPASGARPLDGRSGGRGDTRYLTGMSWPGSGG